MASDVAFPDVKLRVNWVDRQAAGTDWLREKWCYLYNMEFILVLKKDHGIMALSANGPVALYVSSSGVDQLERPTSKLRGGGAAFPLAFSPPPLASKLSNALLHTVFTHLREKLKSSSKQDSTAIMMVKC